MSPNDPRQMGDLEDLPPCAPAGLHGLHALAEVTIQEQIELLGSGTPSKAPDLRAWLRQEGVDKPEDRSKMIEKYSDYQEGVEKVKKEIQELDQVNDARTNEIGGVVKKAYEDIGAAVEELNDAIIDSRKSTRMVTDKDGNPVLDQNGNRTYYLPNDVIDGLIGSIWKALDTTYREVKGVSDKAAAEALGIAKDEPNFPTTHGGGGLRPVSFSGSGGGGGGGGGNNSLSFDPGPSNVPITSTAEQRKLRMEMMEYLVFEKKFTPAQAAGIIGNAFHESKFNLGALGDGGTAHGLFQWRFGRYQGLLDFANKPGEDIDDWRTHMDYMTQELRNNNSYQKAEDLIDANPNDERAVAAAFDEYYEISSGASRNDRRDYATDVLKQWNDKHGSAAVV